VSCWVCEKSSAVCICTGATAAVEVCAGMMTCTMPEKSVPQKCQLILTIEGKMKFLSVIYVALRSHESTVKASKNGRKRNAEGANLKAKLKRVCERLWCVLVCVARGALKHLHGINLRIRRVGK
jgi:hypothetical protein